MVNYFRDFIKGLSSHLIPLTQELTLKKNAAQKCFQMTPEVRDASFRVKDLLECISIGEYE
jgi:hypothetical protein